MKINLKKSFKVLFLIGLILSFVSLFLDWYYFQVYSNGELIAAWNYNVFSDWTTIFSYSSTLNNEFKPDELMLPFIINYIYIGILLISTYGIFFKDVENEKDLIKLYPFSYIQIFLLILNCYYLFVFPVLYLIPNELYFPFLFIENASDGLLYYYCIGLGYCLQIIVFITIFPYTVFYHQTLIKFEIKENSPTKIINRFIKTQQADLDFDKLIAEEELKQKFEDIEINEFFNQESEIIDKEKIGI